MNVFVIGRGIPSDEAPKNGIFEYNQAKALSRSNLNVFYIFIDVRSIRHKRKYGLTHYKDENLNIIGYSLPIGKTGMGLKTKLIKYCLKRVYSYCKHSNIRPDIIHAHFLENINAVIKTKKIFDVSILGTEHYSIVLRDGGKSEEKIKNFTYKNIDALITVSPFLQMTIKRKRDSFVGGFDKLNHRLGMTPTTLNSLTS